MRRCPIGAGLGLAALSGSLMHCDICQYAGRLSLENPYSFWQWEALKRREDAGHGQSKMLIGNVTHILFLNEAKGAQRGSGTHNGLLVNKEVEMTRNLFLAKHKDSFLTTNVTSSFTSLSLSHPHKPQMDSIVNSFKLLQQYAQHKQI